ncbi:MAG: bifunctional demethylmenaquinone methyltransferase/2-methoxy-6-polyprenyl-1,4-benzoquinol methylase UbiE [Rubinisphaera brasiliensis]|uniref:Demethylmenaquinone methyltransferase n=1 Tax=Rubinisphaera brasiliensis (strain ATCC 49424 / DSM 5305 / JCM 21570 / IAM 15109 / NBRC 103401 / IFAM 1448) TaxID=756272 RepID=F0STI1_RUBBR|nr:bifunctional demethylmenaquinone methyltransferase/2-methoxy-6-polyprenyl-1,4-benzoquinol methylase UbiE [Rubinisphaera brasiliensis]ADY60443.1 Ubiquinone/menaquinone biosynthesis methyltransferase ubiE [Rubinisphaera brasiliensis DSM 5305]
MNESTVADHETAETKIDKSNQRVQRMFGEIAPRYDVMNHVLSGGTDYYWRSITVGRAAPQGEAPILDVCTGTGDLALAYWRKTKRRVPVVGTDFTEEMLEIAREKFDKAVRLDDARIEFKQADTQDLPFEDNTFQIVSVAFGLRNVADTMKGLKEMVRVCQPGGRVVILEFSLPGNALLRKGYTWYFRNVLPRIGQFFASNTQSAYNYLPETVSEFPYGKELAGLLEKAGLEQVTFKPLTFGVATLYIGHKPK